jgi:hypothetical protein
MIIRLQKYLLGYDSKLKLWQVDYMNDEEQLTFQLDLIEDEIMKRITAREKCMRRLQINAAEKRRKIVGDLVDKRCRKYFREYKEHYEGSVESHDNESELYIVLYDDGDEEDYTLDELEKLISAYELRHQ